jgi:PAS domain S-box-containing protein
MSRTVARDGGRASRNGSALLRAVQRRLRLTERHARLGWWEWDLVRDRTTWTDEMYRIFGRRKGKDRVSYEEFIKCVHPDDLEDVRSIVRKAFRSRAPVRLDYRIVRPDGRVRWLRCKSQTVFDLRGRAVRMFGTEQDITDLKKVEATLHTLLTVTRDLNSTLDVEALLERLVRSTLALVGAEGGCAGLREAAGMVCRSYLRARRSEPFSRTWAPGEGLAGWAAVHRASCVVNDARNDPRVAPELRDRYGVRSAVCTPLLDSRGEAIGFFEIHNKRSAGGFSAADQRTLAVVAQAASIAVQNALAHRELQGTLEALRAAEAKYRGIYENSIEGIGQCTPEGRVVTANPALARLLGYDSVRDMAASLTDIRRQLYVDPARREEGLRLVEKYGAMSGFEAEVYRKDGSTIWVSMNLRAVRDRRGRTRYYETTIQDVTGRRRAEESLRELTGHLLRSQEEERRRIARELHDSTAQTLAALTMNLSLVQRAADGDGLDPKSRRRLADSLDLAERCCREIRSLAYLLHPPALHEAGLRSAVQRYSEGFASRSGIRVDLRVASRLGRLPEEVEKTLFRIVQESLANIHRHSGSQRARIRLARDRRQVRLEVQDQGCGLHGEAGRRAAEELAVGVGVSGMQERVRQLGGRFEIDSGERGTSVNVSLPLPTRPVAAPAIPREP